MNAKTTRKFILAKNELRDGDGGEDTEENVVSE